MDGIYWNPDPVFFNIFGISVRYYGMMWAIGLFLAYIVVRYQYRDKKIPDKIFEPLFFYCFFGVLIGGRLGHCLFYEPGYYLDFEHPSHFVEMILPIKFGDMYPGGWKFSGYAGLASHGGAIGMIISLWIYARKVKLNYVDILDMIGVAAPLTGFCIRFANLMNSEIVGKVTDVPWAFVFVSAGGVDNPMLPRHPAQLYEAIAYLIFFFVLFFFFYKKHSRRLHRGFFFGMCLVLVFTFRFFVEFIKEDQEAFEKAMEFNMGQWLSVPFVLIGLGCIVFGKKLDGLKPLRTWIK